jgi:hypothetical protein
MWLTGRYESRSTLGQEWTICKRYLGKSSEDSNNEEMLLIINLWEVVSFRARMWLVAAMKLQGQNLLSSCVPRVICHPFWRMWHMCLFVDSEKEMHFPSCNFCLKMRLGEPAQIKTWLQFGWPQQPVRTNPRVSFTPMEQDIMGKLARIVMNVFGAWHSHIEVKRCYGSKITKGGFIKVTSGLMGPMRKGDRIRCLSNGRKGAGGFTMWFKWVEGAFRVIPTQLRSQRYNALVETNKNKINAPSWCWNSMIGVHPWIHQENFKMKILAPSPNLTWLRAAVSTCKSRTDMREIWPGGKYKSYRRLFSLSKGYLHATNGLRVMTFWTSA